MSLITFEFTVPNDRLADIVDNVALALRYNPLDANGEPIPNYPTKGEFIRAYILQVIKQKYRDGKSGVAVEQARQVVDGEINSVTIE